MGTIAIHSDKNLMEQVIFRCAVIVQTVVHVPLNPAPFSVRRARPPLAFVLSRPVPFPCEAAVDHVLREVGHVDLRGNVIVDRVVREIVRVDVGHRCLPVDVVPLVNGTLFEHVESGIVPVDAGPRLVVPGALVVIADFMEAPIFSVDEDNRGTVVLHVLVRRGGKQLVVGV